MTQEQQIDNFISQMLSQADLDSLKLDCCGIDINQCATYGRTPLMAAAAEGVTNAMALLLQNGAIATYAGARSLTALHEASSNGHVDAVRMLIHHRVDVNAISIDGVTPLMCAAAWGFIAVAKELLQNGADPKLRDCTGSTAVEIAREKGEDRMAEFLDSWAN